VVQTQYFTDDEIFQDEIALYKLKTQVLESNREVSKVIRRSGARIVEVNSVYSILIQDGLSSEITTLNEQLKALGCVLQFVRSGRVAITKSRFERVDEYLEKRQAKYEKSKQ
jgi:acetolactate synthase-1/3 small subunit